MRAPSTRMVGAGHPRAGARRPHPSPREATSGPTIFNMTSTRIPSCPGWSRLLDTGTRCQSSASPVSSERCSRSYPQKNLRGHHGLLIDESGRAETPDFVSDYRLWFRRRAYALPERPHPTAWTADRAVEFIEGYDRSQPFFLKGFFARPCGKKAEILATADGEIIHKEGGLVQGCLAGLAYDIDHDGLQVPSQTVRVVGGVRY